MDKYFQGWYYRCQTDEQALAVIASFHKTARGDFCTVQIITDTAAYHARFPYEDFRKQGHQIHIGKNRFGKDGISLDIQTPQLRAAGSLSFGPPTPLGYDIMGPFRYIPFMQCRHSVYSLRHSVDGQLWLNGEAHVLRGGVGYSEGDRGRSFPNRYAWAQCSFPEGCLMLCVADIPLAGLCFTGILGIVLLGGKEYRLATYLGAKAVSIQNGEVIVRQGRFCLTVRQLDAPGHPLQAPVGGAMTRIIHEHPSCRVYYRFTEGDTTLLELEAPNAGFEYEY
jgi:hypothetical protein